MAEAYKSRNVIIWGERLLFALQHTLKAAIFCRVLLVECMIL